MWIYGKNQYKFFRCIEKAKYKLSTYGKNLKAKTFTSHFSKASFILSSSTVLGMLDKCKVALGG